MAKPALILRCYDASSTTESVAALFDVTSDLLAAALPGAVRIVEADTQAPYPAKLLVPALASSLGHPPQTPDGIHYFHGTRTIDPGQIIARGILPLSELLDDIWDRAAHLAPEIAPQRFAELRADIEAGRVDALNYLARQELGRCDDGPHGVLVRELLLGRSSSFIEVPEAVASISFAANSVLGVDLESRYERESTAWIIEFAARPQKAEEALTAACWYLESTLRHGSDGPSGDADCNFSGDGVAVGPEDIVAIEAASPR